MKLYIMRHGETDWNKMKKLQGQSDVPLNDFGRRLAKKTGVALQDVPFDLVITSPLSRARETALIVKGDREIPVIEDARIEEMCFGIYEGYYCKGEQFNIPDPKFVRFFQDPEHYEAPEGGEGFEEFCGRVEAFFKELLANRSYESDTILVSVHGAVLCAMLRYMKKKPMKEFWGTGVHKNCAVTVVTVEDHTPVIERENWVLYDDITEDW